MDAGYSMLDAGCLMLDSAYGGQARRQAVKAFGQPPSAPKLKTPPPQDSETTEIFFDTDSHRINTVF
jgi:hypothetical protein